MARLSEQRGKQHLLKSVSPGERLRLRDDVLRHMRPREWIFKKVESGGRTILLLDESGGFGWSVKIDNIDWEAYEREKNEKSSSQN